MAKRQITLVRHGQHYHTVSDEDGRGGPLTPTGREQADILAQMLGKHDITSMYSSTMMRARETADIVAPYLGISFVLRSLLLCEVIPHIPEKDSGHFARYAHLTPERVEEERSRADRAFDTYFNLQDTDRDEHVLIVAHGNLIRYLVCRVLDASPDYWTRLEMYNTGITRVIINSNGRRQLISHNDVGHLPKHLWTMR